MRATSVTAKNNKSVIYKTQTITTYESYDPMTNISLFLFLNHL